MPRLKVTAEHPDFPHGSNAGYARGCKCDGCRQAHAVGVRENYLKNHPDEQKNAYRRHNGDTAHPEFPHGINAGYVAGCRCDDCRDAHRAWCLDYGRVHRVPGTPGGLKKLESNTRYRKSAKGVASSRKGNATRAARMRGAAIADGDADRALMRAIYANCPDGYEVDHILPLSKGGAHTACNLQYLPLSENRRKNNRLDYDVVEHAISWQTILDAPSTIIPSRGYSQAAGSAPDPSGSRYDLVYRETGSCSQERCESSELT